MSWLHKYRLTDEEYAEVLAFLERERKELEGVYHREYCGEFIVDEEEQDDAIN